jgi:hypothetical protein
MGILSECLFHEDIDHFVHEIDLQMELIGKERMGMSLCAFRNDVWFGRLRQVAHLIVVAGRLYGERVFSKLHAMQNYELFRTIVYENEVPRGLFEQINVPGMAPPARTPLTSDSS